MTIKTTVRAAAIALLVTTFANAQTTQIRIDLEATGPVALAPSWAQFSSTSNPLVQGGATATAGLELLAELGDPTSLIGERGGQQISGPLGTPGGPSSGSTVVTVNNTDNWFNYGSMILPSNDWFVGTGAQVPELDISSLLNGSVSSLTLTFNQIYDAGTEEEDFNFAAPPTAFGFATGTSSPPGGNPDTVTTISLVDTSGNPFTQFANATDVSSLATNGGTLATVTLTAVPEPNAGVLALFCLGGFAAVARRRRR